MKFAILAVALLLPMTDTARAPEPTGRAAMPNAASQPAGCIPIARQVAGENRRYNGSRLDQQPPAQALLAVDRQVDGCREVTFLRQERARR